MNPDNEIKAWPIEIDDFDCDRGLYGDIRVQTPDGELQFDCGQEDNARWISQRPIIEDRLQKACELLRIAKHREEYRGIYPFARQIDEFLASGANEDEAI